MPVPARAWPRRATALDPVAREEATGLVTKILTSRTKCRNAGTETDRSCRTDISDPADGDGTPAPAISPVASRMPREDK